MWIFAPDGLLMPSAIPEDKVSTKWTWGIFDLQVRGRVREHLEKFMEQYMEPGTYNPEIQMTPDMDYNCRFYTTHGAFADAMSRAVMDIDYTKFKPTAEHDREYHDVLNAIWGVVTELNAPGGKWGRIVDRYHYKTADGYNVYGLHDDDMLDMPVGSTFLKQDDYVTGLTEQEREYRESIIEDLDGASVDVEDWPEFVTDYEFELIAGEYESRLQDRKWEAIKADFEKKYSARKLNKANRKAQSKKKSGKKKTRRGVHFK